MDVSRRSFIVKSSWASVLKWIATVCWHSDFQKRRGLELGQF